MKVIPVATMIAALSLGACADLAKLHPCYELTGSALQQCEANVAARHAALAASGGNGGGYQSTATDRERNQGLGNDGREVVQSGGGNTFGAKID